LCVPRLGMPAGAGFSLKLFLLLKKSNRCNP
jgi:hypothetical protein